MVIERPTRALCVELLAMHAPHPFAFLAQGWPSALRTACSLRLSVKAAFFQPRFHKCFSSDKVNLPCWNDVIEFNVDMVKDAIFVVSGNKKFIKIVLNQLRESRL